MCVVSMKFPITIGGTHLVWMVLERLAPVCLLDVSITALPVDACAAP